jgi:hypothetical protein
LKKQSQCINVQCSAFSGQRQDEKAILQSKANFIEAQNGAKTFTGEGYENKPRPGLRKNKLKQARPFDKPLMGKL